MVRLLARVLEEAGVEYTAGVLNRALATGQAVASLDVNDRLHILAVLDDPPDGLAELRAVLLREHEWRVRRGL